MSAAPALEGFKLPSQRVVRSANGSKSSRPQNALVRAQERCAPRVDIPANVNDALAEAADAIDSLRESCPQDLSARPRPQLHMALLDALFGKTANIERQNLIQGLLVVDREF